MPTARGKHPSQEEELDVTTPMPNIVPTSEIVQEEDMNNMELSGKIILLMDILRQCEIIGDKVLVFSQSLVSLTLIEDFLAAEDKQNRASTDVSFMFKQ